MRFCKLLLPLLASTLAFATQPDRITRPIDGSQTVTLAGHVAPQAQAQYDQGPVEASYPLTVTMLLMPTVEQDRALRELLSQQQDSGSPNSRKWLTPEQFADRFSLNRQDIGRITSWLTSQGFKVTYVARGRASITFRGDAAQVQNAFKTEIHRYNVNGESHFANSTAPVIPAALNGIVGGFHGLHNFFPLPQYKRHADYTDSHFTTHFLAPGDIAEIYDINPLYQGTPVIDGTGQKMVIVGQTDIYLDDINDFRLDFFGSSATIPTTGSGACSTNGSGVVIAPCDTSIFQYVISGTGSDPGLSTNDIPESDLDIEWSGSVARNAQIIFVTSSRGVIDSANWAIDNTLAPVISMSYGLCESLNTAPNIAAQEVFFEQAASEGISFFASSGDTGAAACESATGNSSATLGLSVNYPASSAFVTAVGGTEFNEGTGTFWNPTNGTNGVSAISYIPELAWNDSVLEGQLAATGGGPSNCVNGSGTTGTVIQGQTFAIEVCDAPPNGGFPKPTWQVGLTPSDSVRDVPDISFSASNANDPYIVCTPQSEIGGSSTTSSCSGGINAALEDFEFASAFGGTSASAPVMAGITVLLNQFLGGGPVGSTVNPQLYKLFGTNPSAFHDIVAGSNSSTDNNSNNVVSCVVGDPTFEPLALRCPAGGTFGFSAGPGYDLTTGLGSADVNALFMAWAATTGGSFTLSASPASVPVNAGQSVPTTITVTPVDGSTQTVTFSCQSPPAQSSCSFNPPSVTLDGVDNSTSTLTISTQLNMAGGGTPVTVAGTSGSVTADTTVTLTVTANTTENFTMTPSPTSITIAPGAVTGNSVNLALASSTGFIVTNGGTMTTALPLTYTCSIMPAASEATCSVSPAGQISVINPTVSIQTVAPTAQLRPPLGRSSRIFYAMLLPGLFGIFFASGSRKSTARLLSLIVVLGFSTLWLGACSGSSSSSMNNPGTPAGTYTVNVSATTGGGNAIAASTSFMVVVN